MNNNEDFDQLFLENYSNMMMIKNFKTTVNITHLKLHVCMSICQAQEFP